MKAINFLDENATKALASVCRTEEGLIVLTAFREVVLPKMYKEVCGSREGIGRDWVAGRAAFLQDLIDDMMQLRAKSGGGIKPAIMIGPDQGVSTKWQS